MNIHHSNYHQGNFSIERLNSIIYDDHNMPVFFPDPEIIFPEDEEDEFSDYSLMKNARGIDFEKQVIIKE